MLLLLLFSLLPDLLEARSAVLRVSTAWTATVIAPVRSPRSDLTSHSTGSSQRSSSFFMSFLQHMTISQNSATSPFLVVRVRCEAIRPRLNSRQHPTAKSIVAGICEAASMALRMAIICSSTTRFILSPTPNDDEEYSSGTLVLGLVLPSLPRPWRKASRSHRRASG